MGDLPSFQIQKGTEHIERATAKLARGEEMFSKSWAGGFARRAIKLARRAIDYIYQGILAIS